MSDTKGRRTRNKTGPRVRRKRTVFSTPWFQLVEKAVDGERAPYYSLRMSDYLAVVATTREGDLLLVRQFRPAVERYTLELPAGHVEPGESPADAARRELMEEAGCRVGQIELLGHLLPDTGRLSNRMWCCFAPDVRYRRPLRETERGIDPVLCSQRDLLRHIRDGRFNHALHLAAVLLAVQKRKLSGVISSWVEAI